jgi:hypothetical protein
LENRRAREAYAVRTRHRDALVRRADVASTITVLDAMMTDVARVAGAPAIDVGFPMVSDPVVARWVAHAVHAPATDSASADHAAATAVGHVVADTRLTPVGEFVAVAVGET